MKKGSSPDMSNAKLIIFADQGGWRIGVATRGGVSVVDIPVAVDASHETRTAALVDALKQLPEASHRDVLLALPSRHCLSASVATHDLPARQRKHALLYRLEEKLPIAAEELAADFIPGGNTALGVAVEKRTLEPIIASITAAGKRVATICPTSLLALQRMGDEVSLEAASLVLWSDGAGGAELFSLVDGRPAAWFTLPDEPDDVAMHIAMMVGDNLKAATLVGFGIRADVQARLREIGLHHVTQHDAISFHDLATAAGAQILAGKREAWIDVNDSASRRDRGLRKATAWAAAAAIVLLASMAGALGMRAARYTALAEQYEMAQQRIFRQALPGQAMPGDVRSRLASEAQQAMRTTPDGRVNRKAAGQGLLTLRDVMDHLPTNVRFRIYEVQLGENDFTLLGEARSHGDAQGISDALRSRPGFVIDAPGTEQKAGGGVRFTIAGTIQDGIALSQRASR
jgi:hypothetical protein